MNLFLRPTHFDVLLIEDDLIDEMAKLRAVARQGLPYRMHVARSVAQAREALAARAFDVILADCQLPDGTSADLMAAFNEQLVIFVTGAWDAAAAAEALSLGMHDYLIKDSEGIHLQLLHYRVESGLRQRRLARRLRESEALLQAILHHAPAAISAHDLQGRLVLSNRHHDSFGAAVAPPAAPSTAPSGAPSATPCLPPGPIESEETLCHADGSERTYLTVRFPMADPQGSPLAVGRIAVDITARKQAEEKIRNLAFYDPLTGLPNRRMLFDRLQQACANSARHGQYGAAFFIDLDHFKVLNDTLGHDHGDLLLQEVGRRLLASVRGEDTVARIGGDEFVVMTVGLDANEKTAATQAAVVGEKILAAVGQPVRLGEHAHSVTPSIGVSLFRGREHTLDELIKRADVAMYQAKAAGRGTVRFFDPVMQAGLEARVMLESDLRRALHAQQLCLHFQSQVDEHRGTVGAEALLRWLHPQRGLLRPEQFLPLAEQNGLIVPIGLWVLDKACAQLGRWQADGVCKQLYLSVNISARQFRHEGCRRQRGAGAASPWRRPAPSVPGTARELGAGQPGAHAVAHGGAERSGRGLRARRLRHQLLVAEPAEAPAAGPDQDQPDADAHAAERPPRRGHRAHHRRHCRRHGRACRRRGRGNAPAARPAAGTGLQAVAGRLFRRARADGAVRGAHGGGRARSGGLRRLTGRAGAAPAGLGRKFGLLTRAYVRAPVARPRRTPPSHASHRAAMTSATPPHSAHARRPVRVTGCGERAHRRHGGGMAG